MSYRIDTNCSLCFNTEAGCISRHQLVQFHNRMGPRAQQGVRYTAWQHECHNSSFLPVQYFIWGQQFVPERDHKIEGELIFRRKKRRRKKRVPGCWTVHFSRQTPQWGKSHHPNRSYWEAALTQPWARLWMAYFKWALQSVSSQRGRYSHSVCSTVSYQKRCIFKNGPNGARQTL